MPDNRGAGAAVGVSNLAELLLQRAERQTGAAYIFHDYSPRAAPSARDIMSFAELAADAARLAGLLQERGLARERVLLLFGSGLDFIRAYFACILAGAQPVPLRPPLTPEYRRQLVVIAKDAGAKAVLCPAAKVGGIREMLAVDDALADICIMSPEDRLASTARWTQPNIQADEVALIQYTSGSTGTPKGVVVSHANLLANEASICEGFGHDERTIVVGWLPMFHDMGLIGNMLQSLYLGVPHVLMDPMAFVQRPQRLLQLITQYGGTTCGGPNFGYEHCVQRIAPSEMTSLDLSSWNVAYCGAEPIRMQTIERFSRAFASVGFRREAFLPCYGMAEATLYVCGIDSAAAPTSLRLDASALAEHRASDGDSEPASHAIEVVSCGHPRSGHTVKIVDPDTQLACEDDRVGEIWFAGPSVGQRYVNREQLTREAFGAMLRGDDTRYLRTEDLGFTRQGQVYVLGRSKDLIVIGGRKYYPQHIEATAAAAHDLLRPTCGAAFLSVVAGHEALVLVYEMRKDTSSATELESLERAVRAAVQREHGLALYDLVLVRAGVPKTSSGKLQRRRCCALYESGALRRCSAAPTVQSIAASGDHQSV